ncbi:intrastrand cross-link recognition protein-like isoform X2 [Drosophila hydei]|nr:intrastrand cross-link recognition protein-like isoform X2 [Drosophila hydei]
MHAQYQIPLSSTPQQAKGVNLLQLHALQWLYAHAQKNMANMQNMPAAHCCQQPPPINYVQPNLSYLQQQNGGGGQQQPYYNHFSQQGGDGIKQLYNHAQSASQNNVPYNFGQSQPQSQPQPQQQQQQQHPPQHCMGFVPSQQPFGVNQGQHPFYPYGQGPYYGYLANAPNMAYMPSVQQQPFCSGSSGLNFMPPACGQVNQSDQQANLNSNLNSIPSGSCSMPSKQANRKHIFVNGALYNAELVDPPMDKFRAAGESEASFMPNNPSEEEDPEEDTYNPMAGILPSIYGIRFYNPNYGPEGAIPPRFSKKKKYNRNANVNTWQPSKSSDVFGQGMSRYQDSCPLYPLHHLAAAASYGHNENAIAAAHNNRNQPEPEQQLADAASAAAQNFMGSMSPNSKAKRRQGRNRPRGYIQSFGIVAPIKHNNNMDKSNVVAAKNDFSMLDKKSPIKQWDNFDPTKLNGNLDWPLLMDGNKSSGNNNSKTQTKRNLFTKQSNDNYFI